MSQELKDARALAEAVRNAVVEAMQRYGDVDDVDLDAIIASVLDAEPVAWYSSAGGGITGNKDSARAWENAGFEVTLLYAAAVVSAVDTEQVRAAFEDWYNKYIGDVTATNPKGVEDRAVYAAWEAWKVRAKAIQIINPSRLDRLRHELAIQLVNAALREGK